MLIESGRLLQAKNRDTLWQGRDPALELGEAVPIVAVQEPDHFSFLQQPFDAGVGARQVQPVFALRSLDGLDPAPHDRFRSRGSPGWAAPPQKQ